MNLTPVFIPSQGTNYSAYGQLQTGVVFAGPQNPANTFRATNVSQMYSYTPKLDRVSWTYEVGKPSTIQPITYTFRNNTVNTSLKFTFMPVDWTTINGPLTRVLPPQQQLTVVLNFNEQFAKMSSETTRQLSDIFSWTVSPVDVSSQIHVQLNA